MVDLYCIIHFSLGFSPYQIKKTNDEDKVAEMYQLIVKEKLGLVVNQTQIPSATHWDVFLNLILSRSKRLQTRFDGRLNEKFKTIIKQFLDEETRKNAGWDGQYGLEKAKDAVADLIADMQGMDSIPLFM